MNKTNKTERAGGIIFHKNEMILVKSSNPKYGGLDWQLPKGQIDGFEKPFQAAYRECKEEAGLRIENLIKQDFVATRNRMHIFAFEVRTLDLQEFDKPCYEIGDRKIFSFSKAVKEIRKDQAIFLYQFFNLLKKGEL